MSLMRLWTERAIVPLASETKTAAKGERKFLPNLESRGSNCGGCVMSWDKRLDRSVVLPNGKTLRTLEDARQHILTLPKSEHETTAWEVAIEALLIAAEKRDP
jgi:hypothetical protein